jgi:hypothetical protein
VSFFSKVKLGVLIEGREEECREIGGEDSSRECGQSEGVYEEWSEKGGDN